MSCCVEVQIIIYKFLSLCPFGNFDSVAPKSVSVKILTSVSAPKAPSLLIYMNVCTTCVIWSFFIINLIMKTIIETSAVCLVEYSLIILTILYGIGHDNNHFCP